MRDGCIYMGMGKNNYSAQHPQPRLDFAIVLNALTKFLIKTSNPYYRGKA